jgi:MFS family permease
VAENPDAGKANRTLLERGERPRLRDYFDISIYSFGLRGFTFAISAIIVPVLVLDLVPDDRKNTYLGLATFAALMFSVVAIPAMGALSDRVRLPYGRRMPYMVLGTILACALVPALVATDHYILFVLLLVVITLGVCIAQGPYQAFIPDGVPPARRGLASGAKTLFEILGMATIAGSVGYVAGRYNSLDAADTFHWIWASVGVLVFLYLMAMVITMIRVIEPEPPTVVHSKSAPRPRVPDPRDRFMPPGFGMYLVSRFLFLAATGVIETFGLFYLQDVIHVERPAEAAGFLSIIFGVAGLVGAVGAARTSDRIGYRPLVAISGLLGAIGIGVLLTANTLMEAIAGGLIVGIGAGAFFSADWALAIALVAPGRAAQHLGLTSIATAGGAAAARLLGFGVDALNTGASDRGYEGMLLICGIAFLLGGLLVYAVRPATPALQATNEEPEQ